MSIINQLATALTYIEHEFIIDGYIDSEQWAEGLAFGRYAPSADEIRKASEAYPQLTPMQWDHIMARAEHMRSCDGFAWFDQKTT